MYVLIGYQTIDCPGGEGYRLQLILPNEYIQNGLWVGEKVSTELLEPNRFIFDNFSSLDQALGRRISVEYNVFRDAKRIHLKILDDRICFRIRRPYDS